MDDPARLGERLTRTIRAFFAAFGVGVVVIVATAPPAGAHGLGGLSPTNYETRVFAVSPAAPDVVVRSTDLGTELELEKGSAREVVVLGYDGEPYLRVDQRGTFENRRSPARYLNRTTDASTPVPESADPDAEPDWRRIGDGSTLHWHDHRTHWMGAADPPIVRRDPGSTHVVQRWQVDVIVNGAPAEVTGDVRWVPGPSPWPWIGAALIGAVAFGLAGRSRHWGRALGVGMVLLLVAGGLHVVGRFGATTSSVWSTLGASLFEIVGLSLAVVSLVVLVRRGAFAAAPVALFTGVVLLISGGLADVAELSHSQAATTLPGWVNRLAVTLTIAASLGVIAIAWMHLAPARRATGQRRARRRAAFAADRKVAPTSGS